MDVVNVNDPPANPIGPDTRRASIQRCIQSLAHAHRCRDSHCRLPSCSRLKRILGHTVVCERRSTGNCPNCKKLIALCCYHGKNCTVEICPVPFCLSIRKKLKERKRAQLELHMTAERRKDVTDMLLEAISSCTDNGVRRSSISHKESYAKKLERKIFQLANTVADYNRILASQKWEIEMDIELGRRRHSDQR